MYVYHLRAEKPGLHPNRTCIHGDRGCGSIIPGDVAETRGFALSVPKAKNFKRLATCDTLHGSRPNPRQRDSNGRIVLTPLTCGQRCEHEEMCPKKKKRKLYVRGIEMIRGCFMHPPDMTLLLLPGINVSCGLDARMLIRGITHGVFCTSSPSFFVSEHEELCTGI